MSRMKFKFSKHLNTVEGLEIFEVSEADSWDEARKMVEKGVYDRKLELAEKYPGKGLSTGGFTAPQNAMGPAPALTPKPVPAIPNTPDPATPPEEKTPGRPTGRPTSLK